MAEGIVNQVNYHVLTGELVVDVMNAPELLEYAELPGMQLEDAVASVAAGLGRDCLVRADVTRNCQPSERYDQYRRHFNQWHKELREECSAAFDFALLRSGMPIDVWPTEEYGPEEKAALKAKINSRDDLQILNGLRRAIKSYSRGTAYATAGSKASRLTLVPALAD